MITKSNFDKAATLITKANNILVTTHTKPDGDACGSLSAVAEVLRTIGKKVTPLLLSDLPQWYEFLFSQKPAVLGTDITLEKLKQQNFDLIIIVDTNSTSQLPVFADYLKDNHKPILIIDHHVTTDGLGNVELIDTSAAAAGLIVYDLIKYADWFICEKIAQALFVAIATDSGWFRFTNTNSRVFLSCAELSDKGAVPSVLYHNMYQTFSLPRFKLMTAMLNTLKLDFNGRYANQFLLQKDFAAVGATDKDTENLIDECQKISSIEVAALFVEIKDGRIKCSLRSREKVDVRLIAQQYGGGGHIMAAGCYLPGPIENAMKIIRTEIEKQLQ